MTRDQASQPDEPYERDETPPPQEAPEDSGLSVVAWGDDDDDRATPGRPTRGLATLRSDPRLAPAVAGLAALAFLFSLLSEWRVWTLDAGPDVSIQVTSGVIGFPAVGTAYLVGLLALAACAALAWRGTASVRGNARVVGLATVAVLGALLITATVGLDHVGGSMEDLYRVMDGEGGTSVNASPGRGLFLGYAGVAGMALAFYLLPAGQRRAGAGEAAPAEPAAAGDDPVDWPAGDDWPWRPRATPRHSPADAPTSGGPVDLTVEPADPFLPPGDPGYGR